MKREWLMAAAVLLPVAIGCTKKNTPPVGTGPEQSAPITDLAPADTGTDLSAGSVPTNDISTMPPADAVAPAGGRVHIVQRGDTVYKLARQYYNDQSQWRRIAAANNLQDANKIQVGQRLVIP